jgi:integration host factor subunit beta
MTRSELSEKLHTRFPHLLAEDIDLLVDTFFEEVADALARDERVELRGLFTLSIRQRDARQARNPRTGETVHVPAKKAVHFKIGKELHDRLNPDLADN